ncbi:MAG TPA: hypothetical protein DCG48_10665 [Rhodospirillaceae bacterium]|nr:hypothetical protein [Rhodospirillaceae bacterium]
MAKWSDKATVIAVYTNPASPEYEALIAQDGPLREYWQETPPIGPVDDDAVQILYARWLTEETKKKGISPDRAEVYVASAYVEQWAAGKGPSPLFMIAVTLVDLGLEFVGANPALIGLDGNGGKLIAGTAARLADLIPDAPNHQVNFETRSEFGERLLGLAFRAGLQSLSENAGEIIGENHLEEMVVESLKPVIDALPKDLNEQAKFREVMDAITGPAFGAVLGVMAKQPQAFFGKKYDTGKALGMVLQRVLLDASEHSLHEVLSPSGFQDIVTSIASAIADRPELFVKSDGSVAVFKKELISKLATVVKSAPKPLTGDVAAAIVGAALDSLKSHAVGMLDVDEDWDEVVEEASAMVIDGFKAGILAKDPDALGMIFTKEQLKELGRVFLTEVSKNPGMVVGRIGGSGSTGAARSKELQNVVVAVTSAMAEDKNLLLTADDWKQLAAVAMAEVADNPGALVGLDEDVAGDALLAQLMSRIIAAASTGVEKGKREAGAVAFGTTLRETISVTIRAASNNLSRLAALEGKNATSDLVTWLVGYTKTNKDKIGSKQWLRLYKGLLTELLADNSALLDSENKFVKPDAARIEAILKAR